MEPTLRNHLTTPLILTGIFIASSFIPAIQILILTVDGGFIALINKYISSDNTGNIVTANIIANLLPVLILLHVFYRSTMKSTGVIAAVLAMIFMTAFIFFSTGGITEDNEPYFLNFVIVSLISGSILTLVSFLKYLKQNKRGIYKGRKNH
ncbi:MAG: hypothetical protein WKF89_09585 [Chitinophagaceae bacterium]